MLRILTMAAVVAATPIAAQTAIPDGTYPIQRFEGVAIPPGSQHSITIEKGAVTTFDGCNVTSGQADIGPATITWTIPLSTTAADCPDGDVKITADALSRASTWEIRGGSLLIADAAKNTIIAAKAD